MTSQSQDASGVTQDPTLPQAEQPEAAHAKPGLDPRGLLQKLQEVSVTFREYRPVALRIDKAVAERFPEVDRKVIRSAMRTHTASTRYLKAMEKATHRFDLDGNACAEVAEEHRAHAALTLKERFAEVARRKREAQKQDEARRREEEAERRKAEKLQQLVGRFSRS